MVIRSRLLSGENKLNLLSQHRPLVITFLFSALVIGLTPEGQRYTWLVWVGLLPVLHSFRVFSPPKALIIGALFGSYICLMSLLSPCGRAVVPPTLFSFTILTSLLGIYAYFGALVTAWIGFSSFILAVGWIVVELVLYVVGLGHGLLGGDGKTELAQIFGNALGSAYLAFFVVFAGAVLVSLATKICESGLFGGYCLPKTRPKKVRPTGSVSIPEGPRFAESPPDGAKVIRGPPAGRLPMNFSLCSHEV